MRQPTADAAEGRANVSCRKSRSDDREQGIRHDERVTRSEPLRESPACDGRRTGAGSLMLTAAAAPVRLLGVSAQGNAVLIEATEPVAYTVSRPDALTLVVELRNVSVRRCDQPGAAAGRSSPRVRLEQAHVRRWPGRGARASHAAARRRVHRQERAQHDSSGAGVAAAAAATVPKPAAPPRATVAPARRGRRAPVRSRCARSCSTSDAQCGDEPAATAIERVRTARNGASTVVTSPATASWRRPASPSRGTFRAASFWISRTCRRRAAARWPSMATGPPRARRAQQPEPLDDARRDGDCGRRDLHVAARHRRHARRVGRVPGTRQATAAATRSR